VHGKWPVRVGNGSTLTWISSRLALGLGLDVEQQPDILIGLVLF
jgi:hypothetical protein